MVLTTRSFAAFARRRDIESAPFIAMVTRLVPVRSSRMSAWRAWLGETCATFPGDPIRRWRCPRQWTRIALRNNVTTTVGALSSLQ